METMRDLSKQCIFCIICGNRVQATPRGGHKIVIRGRTGWLNSTADKLHRDRRALKSGRLKPVLTRTRETLRSLFTVQEQQQQQQLNSQTADAYKHSCNVLTETPSSRSSHSSTAPATATAAPSTSIQEQRSFKALD